MDLYRVLRLSIYLMVATGAFSLAIAEQNLTFLVAVFSFGVLAYLTVDSKRMKPVRLEFAGAMALALLVYTLLPLREENGWDKHFPAAFAHFLCAFQALLFFTAYRGSVLLTFCQSTLAVVVISGVMQPDASLIVRLILFVCMLSWTLFIHALWRARENFGVQPTAKPGVAEDSFEAWNNEQIASRFEPSNVLPERAFWQGLGMTGGLSIACIALGFVLFFSAPRVNEGLTGFIELFTKQADPKKKDNHGGVGRGNAPGGTVKGWDERASINSFGPIRDNHEHAITVTFEPYANGLADPEGRIYLRGMAFSRYEAGDWLQSAKQAGLTGNGADPLPINDPSAPGVVFATQEIKQLIDNPSATSHVYFAVGPVTRLIARAVDQDYEGSLVLPDKEYLKHSELWTRMPMHEQQLPQNAVCGHKDLQRYVDQKGFSAEHLSEARQLALKITEHSATAIDKVRSIVKYLRESGKNTYSLAPVEVKGSKDRIYDFLFSPNAEQRRGHCGYFATAFVLLCRLNDLPARLASGFCAKAQDRHAEGDNRIPFLNSDAHAWGEVYFRDYGWIVFDSTPAGNETDPVTANKPVAAAKPPIKPMPTQPQRNMVQRAWDCVLGFNVQEQRQLYDHMAGVMKKGIGDASSVLSGSSMGGWLGAGIAWAGVGLVLVWLVQIFLRRGNRRTSYPGTAGLRARAAVSFYNDLLSVLSRRGFVRKPGQTPREFAELVIRRGGQSFAPVRVVTQVFEDVRYGGSDLDQHAFNELQSALDALRELSLGQAASPSKV